MLDFIVTALTFFFSPQDAEALRQTAPKYLTAETAMMNVVSANVASMQYNVEADLLLSIAHHESRYNHTATTKEANRKISCGIMTPEPTYDTQSCAAIKSSLLRGYQAGAAHLKKWYVACNGRERSALLGYAGGYRLIRACARGPVRVTRQGHRIDLCNTPDVFLGRARRISKLRQKLANT